MVTATEKILKKVAVLILTISVLLTFVSSNVAMAFDYPELKLNKSVDGELSDYWGAVNYSVKIGRDCNIKISYTSSVKTEISLRNSSFNEKLNIKNRKKYNGGLFLKKGDYLLSIYNCTYKNGKYSLKLSDAVEYTDLVSFGTDNFFISVGEKLTIPIKKEPEGSIIKELVWSSSSPARAGVDQNGGLTAKSLGKTVVKATLDNGKSAKTKVFVNEKSYTLKTGEKKLLPRINGKKVNWKNSNPTVVKLTKRKFKAKSSGTAVLTKTIAKTKYTVIITVE